MKKKTRKKREKVMNKKLFLLLLLTLTPLSVTCGPCQIAHLIIKGINCGAAMYATIQGADDPLQSIKSKDRANKARFLETVTDLPSYLLKQQFTCPYSIAPLFGSTLSELAKHCVELETLENLKKIVAKKEKYDPEEIKKLLKNHYYGMYNHSKLEKFIQCSLIVGDFVCSLVSSSLKDKSFNKNLERDMQFFWSEAGSIFCQALRKLLFKGGTYKLKGIHKKIDTALPLMHYLIEMIRAGRHTGQADFRWKYLEKKKEITNQKKLEMQQKKALDKMKEDLDEMKEDNDILDNLYSQKQKSFANCVKKNYALQDKVNSMQRTFNLLKITTEY